MEKDNTYRKLEKDFAAIRDERGTQANTANRIGSAFLSLLSYIGSAAFLRKDVPETAEQVMTFLKGIVAKAVSYFQGIVNKGDIKNNGDITNKGNISNAGNITTKNLTVTGKATFFELEIQKAKAAGGMTVNSAGTFHVDAVEETPDGFVCYQRAEKDGVTLLQTCEPKDQMMCSNGMNSLPMGASPNPSEGGEEAKEKRKPHAIGNHYYWRLVTDAPTQVVTHTIDGKEEKCLKLVLSKTDHSKNTIDIPQVGDDLVQIGNRDNKERQSVMMSCAYNSFDPELKPSYWAHYVGVNDYDISKHRYTWFAANGSQVTGNFKVQSDNGGLESIEDYMKSLASENSSVLYKLVMSSSQFNVKADGSFTPQFIYINAYKVQGENLTPLSPSENVKVYVSKGENELGIKGHLSTMGRWNLWVEKEDLDDVLNVDLYVNGKLADKQKIHVVRDGKDGINGEKGADGKNGENGRDGTDGKDVVSYKLLPMVENVQAYFTKEEEKNTENAGEKKIKRKMVDVRLVYKIQKAVGEQVNFTTLEAEGMTLTLQPSLGEDVQFTYNSGMYGLSTSIDYEKISYDSYTVTLKKGSDIVDQRIVSITFKPKVVFDIDTENGEIRSNISTVDGRVNSFEQDIEKTQNTVGNLEKEFTQMKLTSKEISFTVNNGTRPNLLWGSNLDLSEVQDVINRAYAQGAVIQQNTAKKENLQRQLDATSTNDTAKRNDLQKQINDCDNDITAARNNVSECNAAIQNHLRVGIASTKIDSKEWFEYLKGGGVAGADAIKAKVTAVNGEGNYYAGLYWQAGFGAKQHIKVKPNTKYTFSFWIRTEILQGSGYAVAESFNMESLTGGRKDRTMPWTKVAAKNEWERMSYTFTTGDTGYVMVGVGLSGEDDFSGLIYLCRPKLEEGNTATPWCAYDGTVEALLGTGIDIKNRRIIATTDNFKVQNNKGEQTFLVDKNGIISGFRIAQPFDVYSSTEEWRNGKSYSWYIKEPIGSEDSIFSGSYLDGACVNIYNGTAKEVRMTINICFQINEYTGARSALAKLILKPAQLFRAIGVRQQTEKKENGDYITFYPLVPFTLERTNQAYEIAKYLLRVRDVFENVMEVGESYGGIVEKLKVSGIYKNVETLIPGGGYTMKSTDTTIVADTSSYGDANITLPRNPQVGMEVEIINIGTGLCNLETADNTRIFWNEVKTKEEVAAHKKVSLLYVGGSDNLWIYTTEGVCGKQ